VALVDSLAQAFSPRKWGLALATVGLVGAACVLGLAGADTAAARDSTPVEATVSLATLPAQVQQTERLIRSGGPFPYSKDGSVFGNRERQLPSQARGHYREYTVTTPGAKDRGARRIVCGGRQAQHPEACFYTDDHYASFRRLVP
jgi:ribonuclease T1